MFSLIKTWIFGIVAGIVAILGVVALIMKGMIRDRDEQIDKLKTDSKAAEIKDRATEALIRGVANENKPIKRGHFDKK